jgi:hypothetical protein
MKTGHKLFFAIPFDSATRELYERISCQLRGRYPTVTTVIGSTQVSPSPQYSDFASFKAQNRELNEQFVSQIMDADVVIADLTHNNPNVHVELGIALTENKNILRLSGRSVSELGFDIRNLEVRPYKNEAELAKIITDYLDTFFRIKQLPISKEWGPLYCDEPDAPIQLRARDRGKGRDFHLHSSSQNLLMRDGAVQVDFEVLAARRRDDWFGIYFRAGASQFLGSHLAYVRQNGMIEIAVYPGPRVIAKTRELYGDGKQTISARHSLLIQFENNELELQMESIRLHTNKLSHQTAGRVWLAAYNADVDVHSAQMICRDTIDWDQPL